MSNKPVNSTGLRPEKRPTSTTSPSTDPGLATKSAPRPADQPIVSIGSVPRSVIISLGLLALAFVWTYWTTWLRLVHAWNVEPDYSHGYFVVPLALFFLWLRKDRMPQPHGPNWAGLALVFAGLSLHIVGSLYYLEPFNGWSMVVWLTGAAWLLGGREFCQWCLPSALFLVFMVPLPYSIEIMFRQPLQRIATEVSCWMLQSLGLPALAAGNVVAINDMELEVAQACSGLRIFVSIVALAFAYAVIVRRPWWIKALIFASALPIAVVANAVRVALVAVAYPYASTPASHRLAHDLAGWFVIPFAAALMGAFIWYLGKLIIQARPLSRQELLRRMRRRRDR